MARGKFNKRGGGQRLDAVSAEEIELRNERLAAFEEERARRRAEEGAEEGEEGAEGGEGEDETVEASNSKKKDKDAEEEKGPVRVTTEAEHKRNLAKLEAVRKRREVAEKKRKEEEEAAALAEADLKMKAAALQETVEDDSDDDDKKKKKKSGGAKSLPKLSKIDIKKMKPALLKEALKERGLDIQGNAKQLTARLIEYEEAR